jgi:NAD-dependent SIR2 family protein deacetylase
MDHSADPRSKHVGDSSGGSGGNESKADGAPDVASSSASLLDTAAADAAQLLTAVKAANGGLLVLTGAGMSVKSGVPVFRGADGSMSPDFLKYLGSYNAARRASGLPEADDWFSFSVPEMFRPETMQEAWAYWSWRMTRAMVEPADDYVALAKLIEFFGASDNTFVQTSNCDMLHVLAGMGQDTVQVRVAHEVCHH